ncbi:MAG TPA: sigma 54-interacting transcriptional regulator, partial [Polyangiaceae bacterium]|nr:sigma 54-interacting transcriptional regulator [Polyangiaceae bacterium]
RGPAVLLGERGSDREAAARALHALSGRAGPFVAFDCGALPAGLAESELFGHAEGAFAGAAARPGLFRAAEGGTLFLDDLGELPPTLQPKLLRVLRDRTVWPAGAAVRHAFDVRVLAAADRDPRAPAPPNAPARDHELYALLAAATVRVPPLRERREDTLRLFVRALDAPRPRFEPDLAERLLLHDWPGNVRELYALARQLRIRGGWGPYGLHLLEATLPPRGSAPAR